MVKVSFWFIDNDDRSCICSEHICTDQNSISLTVGKLGNAIWVATKFLGKYLLIILDEYFTLGGLLS